MTDPGHPYDCPVFALHECYTAPEEVERIKTACQQAKIGCKNDCKPALSKEINSTLRTFRKKREELLEQPSQLEEILLKGSAKAREVAIKTIKEVREALSLRKE